MTDTLQCEKGWNVLVTTGTFPGDWGRGPTLADAVRKCREQGSRAAKCKHFLVWLVPEKAYVNGMGQICWNSGGLVSKCHRIGHVHVPLRLEDPPRA